MKSAIDLGPFRLHRPIGSGGVGIVWLGHHRPTDRGVAVKVVDTDAKVSEKIAWSFRTEAQAASSLDHPHIVPIYEYGQVPADAAKRSGGRLQAGTPYLVTAFVGGGTLRPILGSLQWPAVLWVMHALLDALAHAHARGVIHRDIKPANVLIAEDRRSVLLTDFGIAYAMARDREAGGRRLIAGTPSYIAPEQIFESWREHGPWTDLYSLGCLAWALASGDPPYGRRTLEEAAGGWRDLEVKRFEPECEVPDGFEEWLRRLIAVDPGRRFRHAADARDALARLEGRGTQADVLHRARLPTARDAPISVEQTEDAHPSATSTHLEPGPQHDDDRATFRSTGDVTLDTEISLLPDAPSPFEGDLERHTSEPIPRPILPIPQDWRREEQQDRPAVLPATGVGLFGLRSPPLIGRESERDRLWASLRRVAEGSPRAAVLRGPTGFGKTRLLRWLAETSHELGVAEVLWAGHGPVPGRGHGLGAMIARYLRCEGLGRKETKEQLRRLSRFHPLPPHHLLTEIICPSRANGERGRLREETFVSNVDRLQVVQQLVVGLSRDRPLLLVLDDAQWGPEALGLAANLLRQEEGRVLIALSACDEALSEEPEAAAMLDVVVELPGCETVETIGPLEKTDHVELVRHLVGLDDVACSLIASRTAGNPMFARHLVGDWIARGVLRPGDGGYHLDPRSSASLPEDLRDMWSARMERVLLHRTKDEGVALELAATLGRSVDVSEWKTACDHVGLAIPLELLAELASQGLVEPGPRGLRHAFGFVQEMLRESLELRARRGDRLEGHHRACARVFMNKEGPEAAERLGRHLFHAGIQQAALGPLLEALEHAAFLGDGPRARPLLALAEAAAEHIRVEQPNLDLARLKLVAAEVLPLGGENERGRALADECIEMTRRADPAGRDSRWRTIAARCERQLGRLARRQEDSLRHFERAARIAGGLDDPELEARILLSLASLSRRFAEPTARAAVQSSLEAFQRLGNRFGIASSRLLLGWVEHTAGNPEAAREQAEAALANLSGLAATGAQAECNLLLGDVARSTGDLSAAQEAYEHACRLYRAVGHRSAAVAILNLVVVRVEMGAFSAARAEIESCRLALERCGYQNLRPAIHLCLLPCLVDAGDGGAFDHHIEQARRLLEPPGQHQVDYAQLAELTGDLASNRGWTGRAEAAYRLAAFVWRTLGRTQEAEELEQRIGNR